MSAAEVEPEYPAVESVALIYKAMDYCHKHGLDFDEQVDQARQGWMPDDRDEEQEEAPHVSKRPSIRRTYHGGFEDQGFVDFVNLTIQDSQVGLEVALRMLDGDEPYQWNEDQKPEFYEVFTVIDATLLREQIERVKS